MEFDDNADRGEEEDDSQREKIKKKGLLPVFPAELLPVESALAGFVERWNQEDEPED